MAAKKPPAKKAPAKKAKPAAPEKPPVDDKPQAEQAEKRKPGRPKGSGLKKTPQICQTIIEGISEGVPLAQICRVEGIGLSTVYDWMEGDEEFAGRIARARVAGYDLIAQDALEIADESDNDHYIDQEGKLRINNEAIQRSKLRVETRLKLLAKWDPKRYGDKQTIAHEGEVKVDHSGLSPADRLAKLSELAKSNPALMDALLKARG